MEGKGKRFLLEIDSFETTKEPIVGRAGLLVTDGVTVTSECTGCGSTYECSCGMSTDPGCPPTFTPICRTTE
jgi:hypothetical protein